MYLWYAVESNFIGNAYYMTTNIWFLNRSLLTRESEPTYVERLGGADAPTPKKNNTEIEKKNLTMCRETGNNVLNTYDSLSRGLSVIFLNIKMTSPGVISQASQYSE